MFCKNCGELIDDSCKFCPSCGTKTEKEATEKIEEIVESEAINDNIDNNKIADGANAEESAVISDESIIAVANEGDESADVSDASDASDDASSGAQDSKESKSDIPYAMPAQASSAPAKNAKSKLVAGLLGIFLGSLGIHNFYLGFYLKAVIQLLLTLLGCCTFGISSIAAAIWGFIEAILILCGNIKKDASGNDIAD